MFSQDSKTAACDFLPAFSHIYIEREAWDYPATEQILASFSGRDINRISIERYSEVFNRRHQSFSMQKKSPSLILAVKHGTLLYPGAKVCQSFGNEHFYYTSFAMNCPFDCEYCYLQGMYSCGHIVIFVNLEDFFSQIEETLSKHPLYLCISYDTDLLALEKITGFIKKYVSFAARHSNLTTEIRTKSAVNPTFLYEAGLSDEVKKRLIFAYTLSPDYVIHHYEHRTPNLMQRIRAIQSVSAQRFPVRLCFDPMLRFPDYQNIYSEFFSVVKEELSGISILDAGVGVFRISDSYLKQMRKHRQDSALLAYPFATENGVCHYGKKGEEMIRFAIDCLKTWIPEDKLFTVEEDL